MGSCIAHRRKKTVAVKPCLAALLGKPLQRNRFSHFRNENRPHQTSATIPKSKQPPTQSPRAIPTQSNVNNHLPILIYKTKIATRRWRLMKLVCSNCLFNYLAVQVVFHSIFDDEDLAVFVDFFHQRTVLCRQFNSNLFVFNSNNISKVTPTSCHLI